MKYSVKIDTGAGALYIALGEMQGFYTSVNPHDAYPFPTHWLASEATFRQDGFGLADVLANPSDAITIYPTEPDTVSSASERHSDNFIGSITKA
jgi:hypothetical protein